MEWVGIVSLWILGFWYLNFLRRASSSTSRKLIARNINDYKSDWCVEKIINECHKFKEKQGRWPIVACMGLAFKPDIDDLRESPAKYITQELLKGSNSNEVLVVEPNIKEHSVFKLTDFKEAYEKSDIVAFLVAHKEFKTLAKIEGKIILDFCGVL